MRPEIRLTPPRRARRRIAYSTQPQSDASQVVTRDTNTHGLGDTLDVVAQNLAVTLGAALAETLSTFAAYEDIMLVLLNTCSYRLNVETYIACLG